MRYRFAVSMIACAVAAPVFMATPSFAQDLNQDPGTYSRHSRPHHHSRNYYNRNYDSRNYSAYDYSGYTDPRSGHYDPEFQRNRENFGFSGRDPSRIGGEDPSLHPSPR
jgi:hypothetical protein